MKSRKPAYLKEQDQLIEHRLAKSNPSNFLSLSAFADGRMYLRSILEQLREQGEIEKLDGFLSNIDKSS